MNVSPQETTIESRVGRAVYMIPLILAGSALSLGVAWVLVQLIVDGRSQPAFMGPLFALGGVGSLTLAAIWLWGARRSRLVISQDQLAVSPTLGKPQSVRLSRLATVDLDRVANGQARILTLRDTDGASAQVGLGVWEREADILRLIGDASQRTGAKVAPEAQRTLVDPQDGS